jgi:hypothetical protein
VGYCTTLAEEFHPEFRDQKSSAADNLDPWLWVDLAPRANVPERSTKVWCRRMNRQDNLCYGEDPPFTQWGSGEDTQKAFVIIMPRSPNIAKNLQ